MCGVFFLQILCYTVKKKRGEEYEDGSNMGFGRYVI